MFKRLLLSLLIPLGTLPAFARDFEYTYEGQTLTYTVLDEEAKTCETKSGNYKYIDSNTFQYSTGNSVSGMLRLPSLVSDGETQYTLVRIGRCAFINCPALTSVDIPNSVSSIGKLAFSDCISLTSITIPNSVNSIEESAFQTCLDLTSVDIPNSVLSIGEKAFSDCISLTSITIPNSVNSIEENVFKHCRSLTSVTIPNSVNSIAGSAFNYCSSLKEFTIDANNTVYTSHDGIIFDKNKQKIVKYPPGKNETTVSIPTTVSIIGADAFATCSSLKLINIPNSVLEIQSSAFEDCSFMSSVTIPPSVKKIGSYVFRYSYNLSEIILLPVNPCSIDKDMLGGSLIKNISLIANFGEWMSSIPTDATVYTSSSLLSEAQQYGNYKVESFPHIQISDFKSGLNHVEFKIKSKYDIKIRKVTFDGVEISSATSVYSVSDLKPGSTYNIEVAYDLEPWGELTKTESVSTKSPEPSLSVRKKTQSTATLKVSKVDDSRVSKPIVVFNGKDYECDKEGLVTITGLKSNSEYSAVAKVTFSGETYYSDTYTFSTNRVRPKIKATEITPTTISIDPTFNNDDVIIEESFLTIQDNKYSAKQQTIVNLPVGSEIQAFLQINNESDSKTFTLPALELKTIAARATSKDCAIICAETNMSEEEYGGGFEWRRYDAPDMEPSTFSPCPVANGHLEGRLKGLSQNTYYKYRPYYEDCNGKRTFGEWTAFITADADVYFEPTVYTYAPNSVTKNSATVVGYAMGGSEDVDEQGFEYWPVVGSRAATDVKRVLATGQRMVVTLADLEPSTRYAVRAFASTRSKTTYGEEQVFETDGEPQSAIEAVTADESEVQPFDIFTLQGVCVRRNTTDLSGLRPGLYIANGRKILVH